MSLVLKMLNSMPSKLQELILSSYRVMLLSYHGSYLHHAYVESNA
jgi:hypothetical protein